MDNFRFGRNSTKVLKTLTLEAQKLCIEVLKFSNVDFSLTRGYCTPAEQFKLFQKGRNESCTKVIDKSKILTYKDGYIEKSEHNKNPSPAFDIAIYIKGKSNLNYDKFHHCYLAGLFRATAEKLKMDLIWGGNWDNDGEIYYDQNFLDLCHYQLK